MMTQFSLLAESIQKALPPDNIGKEAIAKQLKNLHTKSEKWPDKILKVYRNRKLPVFTSDSITKLNQSHQSYVDHINETRQRRKDSLRHDINRKEKKIR